MTGLGGRAGEGGGWGTVLSLDPQGSLCRSRLAEITGRPDGSARPPASWACTWLRGDHLEAGVPRSSLSPGVRWVTCSACPQPGSLAAWPSAAQNQLPASPLQIGGTRSPCRRRLCPVRGSDWVSFPQTRITSSSSENEDGRPGTASVRVGRSGAPTDRMLKGGVWSGGRRARESLGPVPSAAGSHQPVDKTS